MGVQVKESIRSDLSVSDLAHLTDLPFKEAYVAIMLLFTDEIIVNYNNDTWTLCVLISIILVDDLGRLHLTKALLFTLQYIIALFAPVCVR